MTNEEKITALVHWLGNRNITLEIPEGSYMYINASASVKRRTISLGLGMLNMCTLAEIKDVLAHELGHFEFNVNTIRSYFIDGGVSEDLLNREVEYKCDFYACKFSSYTSVATTYAKLLSGDDDSEDTDSHPSKTNRLRRLYKERYYAIE